jgi:hypothetical protein
MDATVFNVQVHTPREHRVFANQLSGHGAVAGLRKLRSMML